MDENTNDTTGTSKGRKIAIGCLLAFVGLLVLGFIGMFLEGRELQAAHDLYAAGHIEEAVTEYRRLYQDGVHVKDDPVVIARLAGAAAEAGRTGEARGYLERSLDEGIDLRLDSNQAKTLLAEIRSQRAQKRAQEKSAAEQARRTDEAEKAAREAQERPQALAELEQFERDSHRQHAEHLLELLRTVPRVTAPFLGDEYTRNEIAAEKRYAGKELIVTGIQADLGRLPATKQDKDPGFILLRTRESQRGVKCYFRKADDLANVIPGFQVEIFGFCRHVGSRETQHIELINCALVGDLKLRVMDDMPELKEAKTDPFAPRPPEQKD